MEVLKAKGDSTNDVGARRAEAQGTPHVPEINDTRASQTDPEYAQPENPTGTTQSPHNREDSDNDGDGARKRDPDGGGTLLERMGNTTLENDRPTFGAKRLASEELSDALDAKRMKTDADNTSEQEVQPLDLPLRIPFPDKPAVLEERAGEIEYRVVINDGTRESFIILTGLKCLFQKQLPKMPKDYIARLVYDRNHLSTAIVKKPIEVIGGICYRAFNTRRFAEIVFCAVSSDQQVKGYGAHLMSHLKDYVRATSPVMHFLTYADNYATGYFQKQGFTKDITLEKSLWMGYIKDYEGGTLMQCSMLPRVRYLEVGRMLLKQKEAIVAKVRPMSKSHIVHPQPQQWANGTITPIDPLSIPAIRATGWCPDMDELAHAESQTGVAVSAPVNRDEVPDYYAVIKDPMDLSTMEERLTQDSYNSPKELIQDLKLIFSNCRKYNDATTVYSKCVVKLEKYMWSLVKEVPEWHNLLEEDA